jgi:hypothetical protein
MNSRELAFFKKKEEREKILACMKLIYYCRSEIYGISVV